MPPRDGTGPTSTLYRDPAFTGVVLTQFLGAFNDNVFRQMVLLFCLDLAAHSDQNLQGHAQTVFALPFVLFSGSCGYLSDVYSKRSIVVLSKVLEIVVMLLGLIAFRAGSVQALLAVLFCMGLQSTLFGPSKYGILPELFGSRDLLRANGLIQMTTFLAIIFGLALAGHLMDLFEGQVWLGSLACIGIAMAGTLTSLLIRPTSAAQPQMRFEWSMVAIGEETRQLISRDRRLRAILAASALFWMTGGTVYAPAINDLGIEQFQLTKAGTSLLAASTGLGIACGCLVGGMASRGTFNGRSVRLALWGMVASLLILALPGSLQGTLLGVAGSGCLLFLLGVSAGLFSVPLLVYLQAQAPMQQRGRIIAAMNLANWIGISLSGQYYNLANKALRTFELPYQSMFAAAALLLIPLLIGFHPQTFTLEASTASGDRAQA